MGLEIVMIVAAVVLMARVADLEDRSALLWGFITLGLCVASLAIPFFAVRIGIAAAASIALMTLTSLLQKN